MTLKNSVATPVLVGMDIFRAAVEVRGEISLDVARENHPVSPVASGFVAVRPRGFEHDMTPALGALGWGRPVAFLDDACGLAAFTAAATESELLETSGVESPNVAFVIPSLFRTRRAAAIERRLERCRPSSDLPAQTVHAVGVGPWTADAPDEVLAALDGVTDLVMTDWTHRTTFARLPGNSRFTAHVLPYSFGDFEQNIDRVDAMLRRLQAAGHRRVGLLVEGNPDTYDVLDGLSLADREVRVTPGVPIGLLAAWGVAERFQQDPFAHSFAYLSGLHGRHKLPAEQFLGELTSYLSAGVTCVLVEMYKGDVELALRAIDLCGRPKSAALMSNHFSDEEQTVFLRTPQDGRSRAAEAARGSLSTMLIADGELR